MSPEDNQPQAQPQQTQTNEQTVTTPSPATNEPINTNNKPATKSGGLKQKLKNIPLLVAVGLLLIGGGVAAYFGVVVPNRPENILKRALANTLSQDNYQISAKLTTGGDADSFAGAFNAQLKMYLGVIKNNGSGSLEINLFGTTVTLDYIYVDKDFYFKVTGLDDVSDFTSSYLGAETNDKLQNLTTKVNDQWVKIDETLMRSYGLGCYLDNGSLIKEDLNFIGKKYNQNPFYEVKEHSNDTVGGRAAKRFKIAVDKETAKRFNESVKELPSKKKLTEACKNDKLAKDLNQEADDDLSDITGDYEITVWVDKGDKRFTKMELTTTEKDVTSKITVELSYDEQNIVAPKESVPFTTFLKDAEALLGPLLGGLGQPSETDSTETSEPTLNSQPQTLEL